MFKQLRIALVMFSILTVITGVVYPAAVTLLAQVCFPHKAQGSVLEKDGHAVGSEFIGQSFTRPEYFWSRPSATSPFPYNGGSSSGSNQGPINDDLIKAVADRIEKLKAADPGNDQPIPVDLVTASASGLDPQISPAAAQYQIARVARVRKLDVTRVEKLVSAATDQRLLGVLGEPAVNVLKLNLALDAEQAASK